MSRRRRHDARCANICPIMFQPKTLPQEVGCDVPLALGALGVVRHFGPDGVKYLDKKLVAMDLSVTRDTTGRRPQVPQKHTNK